MFKPDGWGWRARIGVLTTHIDLNTESELNTMAPEGVSIHATRVPLQVPSSNGVVQGTLALDKVRALVEPPNVDNATELLSAAPLHAIGATFTSSSYALGPQGDEALRIRLEQRTPEAFLSWSAAHRRRSRCVRSAFVGWRC